MSHKTRLITLGVGLALVTSQKSAVASREPFELRLSTRIVSRPDSRREVVSMLELSVPLGRVESPRASLRENPRAAGARSESSVVVRLTPELARATLAAAQRAQGSARARARYDSLSSRARASAALPELRLKAARTTDESLRLAPTSNDPYRYTQAGGVSLALEAQATWRLDRAVFAEEEIQIEHLRRHRARRDERLAEDVLRALFGWQRALARSADEALAPDERQLAELQVIEAEVRLDVLTGGWFSPRAARLRKNALPPRQRSE